MKKMYFSCKSNTTVPSWYQDTMKYLQVDRKVNVIPELTIMEMKRDCQTLEYTIHLIQVATKKLDFVLRLLSPRVAVYPDVNSALKTMTGVKNTLQQLDGFMKKRIAFNDESIDWNLSVDLQKEEFFDLKMEKQEEEFKSCYYSVCDEDHEIVAKKDFTEIRRNPVKVPQINIKDLIMIGMLAIFLMFDPLGLFSDI